MLESGTRTSMVLAIIILFAAFLCIGLFLIMPFVVKYKANLDYIEKTVTTLDRYESLLTEQPVWSTQHMEQYNGVNLRTIFLKGPTPALAVVQLQDRISHALEDVGSKFSSLEILSTTAVDGDLPIDRITLGARFEAKSADLAAVIYDLESGDPYLSLDKLVIIKNTSNATQESEEKLFLDVNFNISGFLLK